MFILENLWDVIVDIKWILGWISFCVIAGVIAKNKGRSGVGFFILALFLTPAVGILAALVVKSKDIENVTQKKCPFCAEIIKREAIVCKHCGREVDVPHRIEVF